MAESKHSESDAQQFIQGMAQFAKLMGELTQNMISLDSRVKAYEKKFNESIDDMNNAVNWDVERFEELEARITDLEKQPCVSAERVRELETAVSGNATQTAYHLERQGDHLEGLLSRVDQLEGAEEQMERRIDELEQLMEPPRMERSSADYQITHSSGFLCGAGPQGIQGIPDEDRLTGTPSPEAVESWCAERGSH